MTSNEVTSLSSGKVHIPCLVEASVLVCVANAKIHCGRVHIKSTFSDECPFCIFFPLHFYTSVIIFNISYILILLNNSS